MVEAQLLLSMAIQCDSAVGCVVLAPEFEPLFLCKLSMKKYRRADEKKKSPSTGLGDRIWRVKKKPLGIEVEKLNTHEELRVSEISRGINPGLFLPTKRTVNYFQTIIPF